MKRVALAVSTLLLAAPALAQDKVGQEQKASAADPMAAWKPPKIAREAQDRKEIAALLKKNEQAWKKGDLQGAAALVDFPVLMVTDDSKGEAMGEMWTRERWIKVMEPFAKPMPAHHTVTHKPIIFLMSDSLASVDDVHTMTMGGKKITSRSSMLLIRRGGDWRIKAMVEGGWGDMPMPEETPARPGTTTGAGTAGETHESSAK